MKVFIFEPLTIFNIRAPPDASVFGFRECKTQNKRRDAVIRARKKKPNSPGLRYNSKKGGKMLNVDI